MSMDKNDALVVFQDARIRRIWHENEWYFSVVDIIHALTDSVNARDYWYQLKKRELESSGIDLSTNCRQLKLPSADGKFYETDCATTKVLFRIIQSIPSKKVEPFKLWLAKVGYERVQEIENPELAQERMKELYEQKGYSAPWIDKRIRGIAVRQELTGDWKKRGLTSQNDFAILTAEISKATFDMTPNEYKKFKGLHKENLRDHMNDLELIFSMLGEASTSELERTQDPKTFPEHKDVSRKGGTIAKNARIALEKESKRKVISKENYLDEPESKKRLEEK